jgi:hypothetical protein
MSCRSVPLIIILVISNVPPSLRDGGAQVHGDAQWGRVEVPPKFRDFREMGDGGT